MMDYIEEITRLLIGLSIGFGAVVGIGMIIFYLKYYRKSNYGFLLDVPDEELRI